MTRSSTEREALLSGATHPRLQRPGAFREGRGARPRRRRDYRVERLVEDVDGLLDAAGLASAHLVGHDWGGIAWEVALRRPKRVLSLTVLSTPHPSALLWRRP